MSQELIESSYSHFLIIGGACLGLVWGGVNAHFVSTSPSTRDEATLSREPSG